MKLDQLVRQYRPYDASVSWMDYFFESLDEFSKDHVTKSDALTKVYCIECLARLFLELMNQLHLVVFSFHQRKQKSEMMSHARIQRIVSEYSPEIARYCQLKVMQEFHYFFQMREQSSLLAKKQIIVESARKTYRFECLKEYYRFFELYECIDILPTQDHHSIYGVVIRQSILHALYFAAIAINPPSDEESVAHTERMRNAFGDQKDSPGSHRKSPAFLTLGEYSFLLKNYTYHPGSRNWELLYEGIALHASKIGLSLDLMLTVILSFDPMTNLWSQIAEQNEPEDMPDIYRDYMSWMKMTLYLLKRYQISENSASLTVDWLMMELIASHHHWLQERKYVGQDRVFHAFLSCCWMIEEMKEIVCEYYDIEYQERLSHTILSSYVRLILDQDSFENQLLKFFSECLNPLLRDRRYFDHHKYWKMLDILLWAGNQERWNIPIWISREDVRSVWSLPDGARIYSGDLLATLGGISVFLNKKIKNLFGLFEKINPIPPDRTGFFIEIDYENEKKQFREKVKKLIEQIEADFLKNEEAYRPKSLIYSIKQEESHERQAKDIRAKTP